MALTNAELMEDIQAEIGESSAESVDLTSYLTDAESCETAVDLLENLLQAKLAAETILSNVKDQIARIKARNKTAPVPCDQLDNGCTCEECTNQIAACGIPIDLDTHEFTDDCERIDQ